MRYLLLFIYLFSGSLWAEETLPFKNDREGQSIFSSRSDMKAISRVLKQIDENQIISTFEDVKSEFNIRNVCSFDIIRSLEEKLLRVNPDFNELSGAILVLRNKDEIDDSVAKILLKAIETSRTKIYLPKFQGGLFYPSKDILNKALEKINGFDNKLKSQCFSEAYKNLFFEISNIAPKLKSFHYEAIFVKAYKNQLITYETHLMLEKARVNELNNLNLNLKSYFRKLNILRTQYPLRDSSEKNNFVSMKAENLKISRRQSLMENYSEIQIILMANIIKKLRERLDSPRAEILIYNRENGIETIPLEPMERFRLAIKLLRKEMALLANNTYFEGRTPGYMDLMVAAFETGIIPGEELEEVSGLEDIWNPKKTFWEKAQVWVRTLSTVATIAIPPPYGFIPALAVVVIEMTAGKKENNNNDPTVLF